MIDRRNLATGFRIPSVPDGYVDQPYVIVNADGSWTVTMTTGSGHEGDAGQHVASSVSTDQGRTWSPLVPIEPPDGPEASWVMPLLVPTTGRIYAFYTYNIENRREINTIDGKPMRRVDSFGAYCYRYSDDGGRSWSAQRYQIPMRPTEIDRRNVYGGQVLFFWGVGKPFVHEGAAYVCASKVGGFGPGFFVENEGVLFRSPNLLTEDDPSRHQWETLPEGDFGIRTPDGGGPIAAEFKAIPMNEGGLFGTFRTIDGYAGQAVSRDGGRSWQRDWMRISPGGPKVKNPRAATFAWRCSNGKYVYWFENHGGRQMGEACRRDPAIGYHGRNPAWLCGGVERDGAIHWSQPEIALYDDEIGVRFSYPDFIEQDGRYFLTETQKAVARVHEIDASLLEGMWRQGRDRTVAREGLLAEHDAAGEIAVPELPPLHNRGSSWVDPSTGATLPGESAAVRARGGVSLEFILTLDDLSPGQVLLDSRDGEGRGILVATSDRGTIKLTLAGRVWAAPGGEWCNGLCESSWDCDTGLLAVGRRHHVVLIVDGGPKIISVLVDGVLCDGGDARQFGWGRFHPNLKEANGAPRARLGRGLKGKLHRFRLYGRALRTSEAIANFHAANG